jgi:hypothetical protein
MHDSRSNPQPRARRVACLAAAFALISTPMHAQAEDRIVVVGKTSLVRSEPKSEAEIVFRPARGVELSVTGSSDRWHKVSLAAGGEGWIPKTEVGILRNEDGQPCVQLSLEKAISLDAVDAELSGTGNSSGGAVVVKGKSNLAFTICATVAPGTVLLNSSPRAQNMVLAGVITQRVPGRGLRLVPSIRFTPDIEVERTLSAFCLDFLKNNPSPRNRFRMGGRQDSLVNRVLLRETSDVRTTQLAIWAIRGGITRASALAKFGSDSTDIAAAEALLNRAGVATAGYRLFAPVRNTRRPARRSAR